MPVMQLSTQLFVVAFGKMQADWMWSSTYCVPTCTHSVIKSLHGRLQDCLDCRLQTA